MRQRLHFFSKYSSILLALVLAVPLAAGSGYTQQFPGKGGPKVLTKDHPRFRAAAEAQSKNLERLMGIFGVVGSGIAAGPDGEPVIRVFTAKSGIQGLPSTLDGFAVREKVTGRFYALVDTTARFDRPVPLGVSTGHPAITAGTIAARVKDRAGNVYALSNNHVYAAVNSANIGDPVLQPGAYDGGTVGPNPAVIDGDEIGTLYSYQPIKMCTPRLFWYVCTQTNTVDAAIARSSTALLGNATPLDSDSEDPDAYYTPTEETVEPFVGQAVKKYGRTTKLTYGTVDAVNVTVDVCYDETCSNIARFNDQISITPGTFSSGGDSGSLIVAQDGNHPVGLLFAGSNTNTLANRISNVLGTFGVTIDSGPQAVPESISVTPANASIEVGKTQQFTATGQYSDGTTRDVTSAVTWQSSYPTVATINSTGLATGVSQGTTDVTAALDAVTSGPARLDVTPSAVTLKSITLAPDNAVIEKGQTLQFQAMGTYSDGTQVDLTSTVTWSSLYTGVAIIDSTGLATGIETGTTYITAALGGLTATPVTLRVTQVGLRLEFGKVRATTQGLTRVPLDYDYGDEMVVVCTANYDKYSVPMPVVPHVLNASGKGFDVILVRAVGWDFEVCEAWVYWMAVKQGTYTLADHGIKMEAGKFQSTRTDGWRSWVGERIYPVQTYSHPVVLGQVMSLNSYDPLWDFELWSVFWARGSSSTNPPNSTQMWMGKHSGEDYRQRAVETVGYVVIEAGNGSTVAGKYMAGVTSDIIRGVGNKPPYRYNLSGISNPANAVAILSSAGMDGNEGGWPILYGTTPITDAGLNLAIDEDWAIDYERSHTTEQAAYLVLEK
jgi:hypothetical protein